jgi:biotin carboxyl carrier protein
MPDLPLHAPFAGTVIAIARNTDDRITAGEALVVLEAMKMEHEIPGEPRRGRTERHRPTREP